MNKKELEKDLRNKIEEMSSDALNSVLTDRASGNGQITKDTRNSYIRLMHYYHLLHQIGTEFSERDKRLEETSGTLIRENILSVKDKSRQKKEMIRLNLVSVHTGAFNIAAYFYEKASKILCQMMITMMDYILFEKAGMTVLYKDANKDRMSYFSLLDEITALNDEYQDCYYYLCAYDFCTKLLADYIDIEEYNLISNEHIRIIENGLPQKVKDVMLVLKDTVSADKQKTEIFGDIEKAYTMQPVYDEKLLKKLADKIIEKKFENDMDLCMSDFGSLVISLNYSYADHIERS